MNELTTHRKVMAWAFGGAVAGSSAVLIVSGCILGFAFSETAGRVVGAIGTIAGIAGAIIGVRMVLHHQPKHTPDASNPPRVDKRLGGGGCGS
jgi:hypothetical protein